MTNKDAFDLWWEWAENPIDSRMTIPAAIHDAVLPLSPEQRRDRAKVNEAVHRTAGQKIERSEHSLKWGTEPMTVYPMTVTVP